MFCHSCEGNRNHWLHYYNKFVHIKSLTYAKVYNNFIRDDLKKNKYSNIMDYVTQIRKKVYKYVKQSPSLSLAYLYKTDA